MTGILKKADLIVSPSVRHKKAKGDPLLIHIVMDPSILYGELPCLV
jgi:hypothetical protein